MSQTVLYDKQTPGGVLVNSDVVRAPGVRVRNIALPVEHGGWGFSLEPVLVGLLVAASLPGLFLAVATMAAFLARQPLKMVMGDRRRGRRLRRTPVAERFSLLYSTISLLSFLAAIETATSYEFLLPILLAAPLALVQLVYDRASRSRALLPELAGATAMASIASSMALAALWPRAAAFGLWAILAARVVPTILYVRARLGTLHGRKASKGVVITMHILALIAVLTLAWIKLVPALAIIALLILLVRALFGFSGYDRAVNAKQIGIRELGFGATMVIAIALGHYFNL
ncbi:MAG TPA: YwiC-like family protein [Pyrinomonadaceae bacterium]|nr:YwiC-like family protein [Pyrinomonadaceae bacterium]